MKKKQDKVLSTSERKRLHVAAMVTNEKEWPQSEPNQGLARMFVIMLLVHVVVIGGVIIYDFVSEPEAQGVVSTSAKKTAATPNTTSTAAATTAALPVVRDLPAPSPAPVPAATPVTATPPAPEVTTPPAASPESLLPSQFAETPVKAPAEEQKHMISSPIPTPAPRAEIVQSEPPAPVETTDAAKFTTETTEKPTTSVRRTIAQSRTEVPRASLISPTTPSPVATPSAARKSLESDEHPTSRSSNTSSTASTKPAATTAKKRQVEDSPPPAKKPSKPVATAAARHKVAKGETIYAIARRYKISEDALMRANSIKNANGLQIGKTLTIPAK